MTELEKKAKALTDKQVEDLMDRIGKDLSEEDGCLIAIANGGVSEKEAKKFYKELMSDLHASLIRTKGLQSF